MPHSQLENYIATFRKQSGLTQQDIASLLGERSGTEISRFESNQRIPTLRSAIGLEIIFDTPVGGLFGGKRQRLEREIESRIKRLHARLLNQHPAKGRTRIEHEEKLRWLSARRAKRSQPAA